MEREIQNPKGGRKCTPPSKKKMDIKQIQKNTIQSLNEVEYFLNKCTNLHNYIKLYKILK